MPHQILAAMFGRIPQPHLRIGLLLKSDGGIDLFVENAGRGAAALPLIRIRTEPRLQFGTPHGNWKDATGDAYTAGQDPAWYQAARLGPDHRIYPGEKRRVIYWIGGPHQLRISARIDADGAVPRSPEGEVILREGSIVWVADGHDQSST